MNFADQLSDPDRRRYRLSAIKSALFGCVSEQIIDSNTMLILYLVMLGGGEILSMILTSMGVTATILLSLPFAAITNRTGFRFAYRTACIISTVVFLLMAAAPFFGNAGKYIVIACCLIYCAARCQYSSTWLPLCDAFLRPEERGTFFGTMRFSYMTLNAGLIFLYGCIMGENPPIWILQAIVALSGIAMLGRMYYMNQLPLDPSAERTRFNFRLSLQMAMRNSYLTGFSSYICLISVSTATIPVAIVFMKTQLNLGAFTLMTITSVGMLGAILGYICVGPLMRSMGMKRFQLLTHISIIVIIAFLLFVRPDSRFAPFLLGGIFLVKGAVFAFLSCFSSTQILSLAQPGNKIMTAAYIGSISCLGSLLARLAVTVSLALGVLTPIWKIGSLEMSKFHFIFIVFLMISVFSLLLLPQTPAVTPKHRDYYNP